MLVCSTIFAEIFPIFWGRPRIETISPVVNPTVAVNHLFTVWNRYSWCKFWLFDCSDDCLHVLDTFNRRYIPRFRISKQCFPSFESPFSRSDSVKLRCSSTLTSFVLRFRTFVRSDSNTNRHFPKRQVSRYIFTSVWWRNTLHTLPNCSANLNLSLSSRVSPLRRRYHFGFHCHD